MNENKNIEHLHNLNIEGLADLIKQKGEISYSKFCPLIGLECMKGNSKKSQLKALEQICEYEKVGTKFRFLRLRDEDELSLGGNQKYSKLIEDILATYLINQNQDIAFFTILELIDFLGLANKNYLFIKNGHDKWYKQNAIKESCKDNFTMKELNIFLNNAYHVILKPVIRNAIKAMDNKRSIRIQSAYKGFVIDNEGNRKYYNILTSQEDGMKFTSITSKILKDCGYDNIQQVHLKGKEAMNEFYKMCNVLCKETTRYDGYYDCYAIILNREGLGYYRNQNINILRQELNKRIVQRFLSQRNIRKEIPANSQENLIEAFIKTSPVNPKYNFQKDYEDYKTYVWNNKTKERKNSK